MTAHYDEERLGELIAALPPAPVGWAQAARELPAARREIDALEPLLEADAAFRAAAAADPRAALAAQGLEPRPELVAALRARLASDVA